MKLSIEKLRCLVWCDGETGKVYWKARERSDFTSNRSFARFNSTLANKEALVFETTEGYLRGRILGHSVVAHRVIWALVHGEWADCIDHINHDRKDNRIANLRSVTKAENSKNQCMRKQNTSGVTGVHWLSRDQVWRVKITVGQKSLFIGNFRDKTKAIAARLAAEAQHGFHPNHGRVSC